MLELDRKWLGTIVARCVPSFYLHHDDVYFPCSAEYFLNNSRLMGRKKLNTWCSTTTAEDNDEIACRGCITSGDMLLRLQEEHSSRYDHLWLDIDPTARNGQKNQLNNVPVYCHVKAVQSRCSNSDASIEALEITYITLFAYNGEYRLFPFFGGRKLAVGAHDGDIEHITVRVAYPSGDVRGVFYNSHRSRDGQWVAADRIPRDVSNNGRILAYVAKHGHGNYPFADATIYRHFFLGNDKTSSSGPVWSPHTVIMLPHSRDHPHNDSTRNDSPLDLIAVFCTRSRGSPVFPRRSILPTPRLLIDNKHMMDIHTDTDAASTAATATDVVFDHACDWVFFRGNWGGAPAMMNQRWYFEAETPVSRTSFQRLFLHFWPETIELH